MGEEGGATPAPAAPKTTTSGAQAVFETNAWLTAAAVAVYTTKALWVKLREMGFAKGKKSAKPEQIHNAAQLEAESETVSDSEAESESEFDATQQSHGHIQTQVINVYPI